LVVIAIIAILAAIVLVAINPAKRFQDARASQRKANVESIMSAIQQAIVDNKGIYPATCPTLPTTAATAADITSTTGSGNVDMSTCLASYLAILPVDPQTGSWAGATSYDTKYTIWVNGSNQITISAPQSTSDGQTLVTSVTR
jgi:type IV pilus assembly protein PilA